VAYSQHQCRLTGLQTSSVHREESGHITTVIE